MSDPVFQSIQNAVEADDAAVTEIESYCVNCGENGTTRLLLTEIPYFKQVVIMSFDCPHCQFYNCELQPAQQIGARGMRYELKVENVRDLSRQLVKTEWANVKIPEIEFEVKQQNGLVTTVEGIVERAITGLQYSYDNSPNDEASKVLLKNYIDKMQSLISGQEKFTMIIDDVSGNSFIENFCSPNSDPQLKLSYYIRSVEEDRLLGIYLEMDPDIGAGDNIKHEVLQFATNCPYCNAPCFTNMKVTNIPHFKEVIIMATNCDVCAHRTNEIKSGAGIEDKGVRISLKIETEDDLMREVVRSDTCNLEVPELQLELHSTGSGRYTTIQGLGLNIIDDLQKTNPFIDGDSTREEIKKKIEKLNARLQNMIGLTVILDDSCGNTYVEGGNVERYERTFEQNEELGLNDMKTDNYENIQQSAIQEEDEEMKEQTAL